MGNLTTAERGEPALAALAALAPLVGRLAGRRVLVLGDMVADEYILGRPTRLSREAPIPILEMTERYIVPGGGANLAANLRALGAEVAVAGVVGDDPAGVTLRRLLADSGVHAEGLVVHQGRPTSTKTRIVGGSPQQVRQQVARVDHVDHSPIGEPARRALLAFLAGRLPQADALIVSDYENGVINQDVIETALPLAQEQGIIIAVDSHGDLFRFKHITVATPNEPEAEASTGQAVHSDDDLCAVGQSLLAGMAAQGILITRGSQGMALFERDRPVQFLPVPAATLSEVRDATGAGDTVAAAFTLALAAGATMLQAAQLGNVAAGLVVRKFGVATVSAGELTAALLGESHRAGRDG
jgi:rfaE bifunctional protein kinase chain/domain